MKISAIVPTFRERARIGAQLGHLDLDGVLEIIVVDGQSDDGTAEAAERAAANLGTPVFVHAGPRGRAVQMNLGARHARGDVLWFVHADTVVPVNAPAWITRTLANPAVAAGAFKTHTVVDAEICDGWRRSARYWLRLADVRSRYTGLPYGDQAIFVRRESFEKLGGFREIPLMEDLDFSMRLAKHGRIKTLPANVRVSGRRFLKHPIRDTLLVNLFPILFRSGVSPTRLARLYRDVR